jgi:hypothetical protein
MAELSELARLRGATAVGVLRADGAAGGGCVLAPALGHGEGVVMKAGDRIAVLA